MRLLILNWQDRQNPLSGGAETHLHEVFGRLARRGWDVDLVCSGWPGAAETEELDGIRVHRIGGRHTHLLRAPGLARRLVSEHGHDLIVEDLNKVPLFTPRWSPVPVVLLVHHLFGTTAFREAPLPVAALTWLLERPIPRLYRGVPTIAVSESTRADLGERGLQAPIRVIPNGIDPERLVPGEARAPEPLILYLGRLKRYKRIDLILAGVRRLLDRGTPVRLVVAGRGDHGPALEAYALELGIADRVRFEGWVDEDRKRELLQRAWVHTCTSPKEGWGIVNLEAAACGTPTVASDSPGLRDSVRDGVTGLLVPHGDVDALADAYAALVNDPDRLERYGRSARAFAEGLSWDDVADRMAVELETLVVRSREHR